MFDKCKSIIASFDVDKTRLEKTKNVCFTTKKSQIRVSISQEGNRIIELKSNDTVSIHLLLEHLSTLEKMLYIFDGRFFSLETVEVIADPDNKRMCEKYIDQYRKNRLSYYRSRDYCNYSINRLIDFEEILDSELYDKWEKLLDDLDIANQIFLYSTSKNNLPIDLCCAFLIELAEPLIEIIKKETHCFVSLNPGERGTSLKQCIDALITKYGTVIFNKEIKNNYDSFINTMVNSRVRIMHIKCNQKKLYFNGKESVLYSVKLYLLYRIIILELLCVDNQLYSNNLQSCIESWDKWNNVLCELLRNLQ